MLENSENSSESVKVNENQDVVHSITPSNHADTFQTNNDLEASNDKEYEDTKNITINYKNGDKYVGELLDGKRHGKGKVFIRKDSKGSFDIYEGEWKDDKRHGFGTYQFSSGLKFKGQFENDDFCGIGYLYYTNGDKYIGNFMRNNCNGYGVFYSLNGDRYEGEYLDGKHHGKGTLFYRKEYQLFKYTGEWENGKPHGKGKIFKENENGQLTVLMYEGQFSNGVKMGFGIYNFSNGSKYIGEWKNEKRHGKGTFKYAPNDSRESYEGEWIDDLEQPRGILKMKNGVLYDGEFNEGLPHGRGVQIWPNQEFLYGSWRNGAAFGVGLFQRRDGKQYFQYRYNNNVQFVLYNFVRDPKFWVMFSLTMSPFIMKALHVDSLISYVKICYLRFIKNLIFNSLSNF